MRYNVGDIVRISKKCHWYGRGVDNPKDTDGSIERISMDNTYLKFRVEWDNGGASWYNEYDLKLRSRALVIL